MNRSGVFAKRVAILLVVVLFLGVTGVVPVGFSEAASSLVPDSEGWYAISTADELKDIANIINSSAATSSTEYKIKLTADITLPDNNVGTIEYENWTPIKNFKGTFDGGGHVINNLKLGLNLNHTAALGFFENVNNSTIKDVTFKGSSIKFYDQGVGSGTTFNNIGVVAGTIMDSTLSDVSVDGASINLVFPGSTSVSNINKFAGKMANNTMTNVSVVGGSISVTAANSSDTVTVTGKGDVDEEVAKSGTTPAKPTNTPVATTAPTSTPEATVTPTITPTTTPTTGPAVTPVVTTAPATPSAVVLPTVAPTATPSETIKPPTEGTIIKLNDAEYKILADGSAGFYRMDGEKPRIIRIPDTVTAENGEEIPVTRILMNAFNGEDTIRKVIFGRYIEVVEESAFEDCTALKTVVTSSVLRIIEKNAFRNCKNLRKMKLPKTIEYIGDYAFRNCKRMKTFIMGNAPKNKNSSLQKTRDDTILPAVDSETVFRLSETINITIGVGVFQNCQALKRVVINVQVTVIGDSAFSKCKELAAIIVYSKQLRTVGNRALTGVHDCKISVYKVKLKKYKKLFKNKGQGKKVIVAKF